MPTTGPSLLAATGELSYNGVQFSCLFDSNINGEYLPDDAGRTTKGVAYTLKAEGIVTPEAGSTTIEANFATLRLLLSQPAGTLVYRGRGFGEDLVVNPPGGSLNRDLAWGPIPKVLHFQPLGNGLSAHVRWQCTFTISEKPPVGTGGVTHGANPIMQFSYGCTVSYDEECYSSINLKGVLEVPLTRLTVNNRTIPQNIVDSFRSNYTNILFDPSKFRVVDRSFDVSPDRRTIKWSYSVQELPPMDLPPGATKARGSMDVQPLKMGGQRSMLLLGTSWSCTLRCTYTIRKNFLRRQASIEFFHLLLFRMRSAELGLFPTNALANEQQQQPNNQPNPIVQFLTFGVGRAFFGGVQAPPQPAVVQAGTRGAALLSDFRISEGLYLESKSITFEASWVLFTTFRTLLDACGVWRWPQDGSPQSGVPRQRWATSVSDIMGWRSWLANQLNPDSEVIVDMGGGGVVPAAPNIPLIAQ